MELSTKICCKHNKSNIAEDGCSKAVKQNRYQKMRAAAKAFVNKQECFAPEGVYFSFARITFVKDLF